MNVAKSFRSFGVWLGLLSCAACGGSSSSNAGRDAAMLQQQADGGATKDLSVSSGDGAMSTPADSGGTSDLATHDAAMAKGGAYCAGNTKAIFCDDFTSTTKTAAQWTTSKDSSSTVAIDSKVPYKSGQTLHVHMNSNGGHAYLTGAITGKPTTLYGRMRLYIAPLGSASGWPMDHTDFFQAIADDGDYGVAEQFQQLSSISTPEVGGNHFLYPGCTDGATKCAGEAWPSGQWFCLEWELTNTYLDIYNDKKGGTNLIYWLYVPGTPATSALLSDQYGNETQFPKLDPFSSMFLGGALYGNDSAQGTAFDFYYANFAVGLSRFNDCGADE